jgi:membrane-bound ClpP family serine protease
MLIWEVTKMTRRITFVTIVALFCVAVCSGDTFKHRETGEVFHGFATQKTIGNRTRIYNKELESFKPINLAEYDITPNAMGRRNNVVVIPISQGEVILSKVVSETLGRTIIDASNKGPRFILLEIDSPGGRGEYAKQLSATITQTNNCPVIAFIGGGKFGGAYSVAVSVALACDRIYIASEATMGAVAPLTGTSTSNEDVEDYTKTFSAKGLSAYKGYITALAERNNRPSSLAMAMVDGSIEVIEVADRNDRRSFINKTDKKPAQSVVRTWVKAGGEPGQALLTLTPNDAVYCGMADKIANSRTELLTDMGAADARLIKSGQTTKTVRKFVAVRRNIKNLLASTDYLQKRVDELEKQLNEREKQQRQSTVQREYVRGDRKTLAYLGTNRDREARRGGNRSEAEIVKGSAPLVNMARVRDELAYALVDLIRDYNRVVALARRWPGALPIDITLETLENRLASASAIQNDIIYRRGSGIVTPGGGAPLGRETYRGRGINR